MPFAKQKPALEAHDKIGGIVVAEDVSKDGHKRYLILPRAEVLRLKGPFNELIREESVCRLYFDLDGDADAHSSDGVDAVRELIEQVCARVYDVYAIRVNPRDTIVLCSSNETKYSKHILFPDVIFKNNWIHMRNFVRTIDHPLVDDSVYTRNRCFRMEGCWKYADPSRVFRFLTPPVDSLVQCDHQHQHPLEFVDELTPMHQRTQTNTPRCISTRCISPFTIEKINIPEGWKSVLKGLEPDDLLMATRTTVDFSQLGVRTKELVGPSSSFGNGVRIGKRDGRHYVNGEDGTNVKKRMDIPS